METLESHEDDFTTVVHELSARFPFVELLAERSRGAGARLNTQSVTALSRPTIQGAAIRAWSGERWVESASSRLDAASLRAAADGLGRARSDGRPTPGTSSTTVGRWATRSARPLADLETSTLIGLGRDAIRWAKEVPEIREMQFEGSWSEDDRLYVNSAGARASQRILRGVAVLVPIAFRDGRAESAYVVRGREGGQEVFDSVTEPTVRAAAEQAREMLGAGTPPAGDMNVILDPGACGVFAHESFGHGTEADQFVRNRSYLAPLLGTVLGPDEISIVDDGTAEGGWGSSFFDDEGNRTQKTVLVDHGKFVGALHDRVTAAAYGVRATGNTRRADFLSRPYVRMTNTYVAPGDWTKEELVEEARDGVLLERAMSGVEDPLGGQMQIRVHRGHRIEHGEVTGLVSSMALSGRVLDFLRAIRGVDQHADPTFEPGSCGKGSTDLLPVADGGSFVLSRAIVGPA
ncbi:MAG TPA: TldD/PmbA family protein [Thermoplasmata archaeon]|nr:TldD/PmbA family protein [Thermoplasmata archaeon]